MRNNKTDHEIQQGLQFIQRDILPNLGKRKEYLTILKKDYPGHSKNRTNEYLATLMLILDKILPYIYFGDSPEDIWQEWIRYQDTKEHNALCM